MTVGRHGIRAAKDRTALTVDNRRQDYTPRRVGTRAGFLIDTAASRFDAAYGTANTTCRRSRMFGRCPGESRNGGIGYQLHQAMRTGC